MFAYVWLFGSFAVAAIGTCIAECCMEKEELPVVETPLLINPQNDYAHC